MARMILLHGTGTRNKGAELMALAVLEHFRARPDPPEFAVPPDFGTPLDRAKYGLWTYLPDCPTGRTRLLALVVPRSLRQRFRLAVSSDIVAVIDASGFHFGDQHGARPTKHMAACCKRWKRQGKKIVLLPQAFGPFTSKKIRTACRVMIEHCDLVFARDTQSYQHLIDVVGERPHILIAPDFTLPVRGMLPSGWQPRDKTVFIVPNMRMIDRTDRATANRYIPFLTRLVTAIERRGLRCALLVHTPEDMKLAELIQKAHDSRLEVVEEVCPLRLKGILSTAYAVISSRFHALVGALSQAVPALAVGWSHKYEELMREHGCPRAIVDLNSPDAEQQADAWLDQVADESARRRICDTLVQINHVLNLRINDMWSAVDKLLGIATENPTK